LEKNTKPLILVTNDDGYFAPGLHALIEMVKPYGEVLVVAPEQGMSGMSHAITIKNPLRITLLSKEIGVTIYKLNGTPVDCVKMAINQIADRKPDILVSGINHGSNSSINVVYSGTMGGAIEGCLNGIPSIGFSLCSHSMTADFTLTKKYSEGILKKILEYGLPSGTCLNVNFPVVEEADFRGIKVCRQARGVWKEEYEKRIDPHGGAYYWLTGDFNSNENGSTDTDEWALDNNFATIVPIKVDYTDHDNVKTLQNLSIEIQ
jgi:5'-nucleotidase